MTTVLAVDDLTIEAKGEHLRPLVNGVSFSLEQGQCLGLVGESGSGKSLTLRSLIGLLPRGVEVSEGEFRFAPRSAPGSCEAYARSAVRGTGIGMVFQEPLRAMNPMMRVGSVVTEPLRGHFGFSKRKSIERAAELLIEVGIVEVERVMAAFPHQLSGGLRQRVLIAAALACEPRVLLCDEPTTALDVTIQAQILRVLIGLMAVRDLSLIFVSHDLGVISQIANSVAVMYAGEIVEIGPTADVLSRPAHVYTDRLLRAVPSVHAETEVLESIPGMPPLAAEHIAGCSFAARRHAVDDACRHEAPVLSRIGPTRASRCVRSAELVEGVL